MVWNSIRAFITFSHFFDAYQSDAPVKLEEHPEVPYPQAIWVFMVCQVLDPGALGKYGQFVLHFIADFNLNATR
jgi:hypothetical protein